ncbi:dienelactone hydrolase family protein [uncultured Lacinutrix sp.]|uniref:dienelactone hydrolase family protein n=1 Tax=uncultured Lacinutrix sp. TaxID=574032 RepID=UPI00261357D1|nr:dienelactone hydrolase family protein [uncultured Lacinutrix sp.]
MRKIVLCVLFLSLIIACKTDKKKEQIVKNEIEVVEKKTLKETITFPSKDGLTITADVYKVNNKPVSILLCHQAGFSRGEYKDTAVKLNELGYSVMAIDQRSGNIANDIVNETAKLAKSKDLGTAFLDARQDIEAAIDYTYINNGNKEILLVGSSYSATLALLIANKNDKINAVAAFSPGEYFKGMNIQESIKTLSKPVFVTASNNETKALEEMMSKVNKEKLVHYKPKEKGIHGSRALWITTEGVDGYWKAFKSFLKQI